MRRAFAALLLQAAVTALPVQAQQKDLVGTARAAGRFGTLLAALDAADLTATLRGPGPFTVFAPTDEAFARLPSGTVEGLLRPENREKLRAILLYHVVPGRVSAATARTLEAATTAEGRTVRLRADGSALRVNDATVVLADVAARNGVIHVIDEVLLPSEAATTSSSRGRMTGGTGAAAAARDLIDIAIRRGVPLYNRGEPGATAAIYEVAARGVLALGDEVPTSARRRLSRALRDADASDDDRAWALRRALDEAARSLDGRTMSVAGHH